MITKCSNQTCYFALNADIKKNYYSFCCSWCKCKGDHSHNPTCEQNIYDDNLIPKHSKCLRRGCNFKSHSINTKNKFKSFCCYSCKQYNCHDKECEQEVYDISLTIIDKKIMDNGFIFYSYDFEWQKPVITEYQTFLLFKEYDTIPENYFAFPWASLQDAQLPNKNILDNFKIHDTTCFTVIQTIHFRKWLPTASKIGITHVFSPHVTSTDANLELEYNIKILPYTLFPVQQKNMQTNVEEKYLTSFIGAFDQKCYISDIRVKIFDVFTKYDDCFIKRRDQWQYEIETFKKGPKPESLELNIIEYKKILSESIFSLCPSGSGPNTIRIWESMSYGVIPVIIADTILFPKLKNVNWEEVFIFWKESEIHSLHSHLLTYSKEQIQSMSNKNIELFYKYFSKDVMINSILEYYDYPIIKSKI